MEDKKKLDLKNNLYFYIISLAVIASYISLWFIQIEVFLWICLGVGVIGLVGGFLKIDRNTYIKTILSIKTLDLIGILFIVRKSIKYILISENVLNLLSNENLRNIIASIRNFGGLLVIIVIVLFLLIVNALVVFCYSLVYLIRLCKDNEISKFKCVMGCISQFIPIISWIVIVGYFEKSERNKHNG